MIAEEDGTEKRAAMHSNVDRHEPILTDVKRISGAETMATPPLLIFMDSSTTPKPSVRNRRI